MGATTRSVSAHASAVGAAPSGACPRPSAWRPLHGRSRTRTRRWLLHAGLCVALTSCSTRSSGPAPVPPGPPGARAATAPLGTAGPASGPAACGPGSCPGDRGESAFVTLPEPSRLCSETLAAIGLEIDTALAAPELSGATHSILVVDADASQVIYERQPDSLLVPASNVKLVTTATALDLLGEESRGAATVYAASPVGRDGVVRGDLVLQLPHELGWSSRSLPDPRFFLTELARRVRAAGIVAVGGSLVVRGELVYEGNPVGTYDPEAHRTAAVAAFRAALEEQGVEVAAVATSGSIEPPPNGEPITAWPSFPLPVVLAPVNGSSHNELADLLLRKLGWQQSGESSALAGAPLLGAMLSTCGLDVRGISLHDGSGLSHANRLSARQLVGLQSCVHGRSYGVAWERSWAVAAVSGTLRGRMKGPDTAGRVMGKTGTLNGVVSLSGVLEHRHDGRRYLFSFLMNRVRDLPAARNAHDVILESLGRNWRRTGSRPEAPVLESVVNDGNGRTVTVCWRSSAPPGTTVLWRSVDGRRFPRAEARLVAGPCHRTVPIEPDGPLFVRVTALGPAGHSDPSDVYGARVAAAPSSLLLVDGNDRWQAEPQPENPLGRGHDSLVEHATAIAGHAYDSCSAGALLGVAGADGRIEPSRYRAIIWSAGEESTQQQALSAEEQALLARFAGSGGALFISGAEIGWDLDHEGSEEDRRFYAEVLGARLLGDDAATSFAAGTGGTFAGLGPIGFYRPGWLVATTPDRLEPTERAVATMGYVGGLGGAACVERTGPSRILMLGFPFECIDSRADRQAVMTRALARLLR